MRPDDLEEGEDEMKERAEYENKFIVINTKHLTYGIIPRNVLGTFFFLLKQIDRYIPDNKYYVCNQDEPYAEHIIETILTKGENYKWTSVNDNLPDELQTVAVIFKRKDGKRFVRETYRYYDEDSDLVWDKKRWKNLGEIIYWSCLPMDDQE